jgi:lysophospholipase L1-like esterase
VSDRIAFNRSHNSKGLRSGREIGYQKPAGVKRVLLLGDSFTWGFGVEDHEVLTHLLQEKVGRDFEIINGSVVGYGTDQQFLWLEREGLRYRPDLVVLAFYSGNDYEEISHSLSYGYPKPVFDLDDKGLLLGNVPVPDTRETRRKGFDEPSTGFGRVKKFLRYNTHTYPFITSRLNSVHAIRAFFIKTGIGEEFTRSMPGIPYYRVAPEKIRPLAELLIRSMNDLARKNGAELLLMHVPPIEENPAKHLGYQGSVDWERAYKENSKERDYLSSVARRNSVPFLDLLQSIRFHHERGVAVYNINPEDHHWNREGQRIAAEALYDWTKQYTWAGNR